MARNLKPITINKIIQRLRQIVGYAVKCGYIQRDPFADYKPLKEKKRLVYLTPEELQKLENYHFSQRRLEQVKNIYLFSVYTGLAYNEASQLQRKHLITGMDGKLWIEMVRQKTGREFAIPLLPQAAELLRILAPGEGDGFLLPRISNQKINSYPKEIGEIIGIDKRLTHHTARKTFATTVLLYNDVPIKVTTIRQIIAQLPDEIRSQCGILCSEASRQNAGEYYQELTANNTLSLRITFLTCAYFAGVDIAERFHLISISDATKIYTMLSTARLTQIAGRCRHPEGVFSETVIYSTKQYDFATSESLREFYLKMAQDLANYDNDADTLQCKYPNTLPSDFLTIKESVVEKSRYKGFGESPVPLIRTNIEGTCVPAYMNIDAIYERLQLRLNLYSTPEKLPAVLQEEGHTITTQELLRPHTDEQTQIEDEIEAALDDTADLERVQIIAELQRLHHSGELNERNLTRLRRSKSRKGQEFINRFQQLYPYLAFDQLIEKLPTVKDDERKYRSLHNSVLFWALDNKHPFKQQLISAFPVNSIISSDALHQAANEIFSYHCDQTFGSPITARRIIGTFIEIDRPNTRTDDRRVLSHKILDLSGSPLQIIPATADLRNSFLFSTT